MVEPDPRPRPGAIAANLERVRERGGAGVEILVATKYVPLEEMGALAEAGVTLVGENRQQDLAAKHERWGDAFEWDFIGNLQSRKVKQLLPLPADPLGRHRFGARPARQPRRRRDRGPDRGQRRRRGGQGRGRARRSSASSSSAARSGSAGLMTMPPFSEDPEASRPHFARLAELAAEHGLERLSMGTIQDWQVAVDEGATIVRLGTTLLRVNAARRNPGIIGKGIGLPRAERRGSMALRDTWHRALVYFGLAEDHDYGHEYDDVYEPDTGSEDALSKAAATASRPRSAACRRHAAPAATRSTTSSPTTSRSPASRTPHPAPGRQRRRRRPGPPRHPPQLQRRPAGRRPVQAQRAGDPQPADHRHELSKRLIDFCSGLTYALDGGMQRIADKIFLLTPAQRRGLRRGEGAPDRQGLLQPVLGRVSPVTRLRA